MSYKPNKIELCRTVYLQAKIAVVAAEKKRDKAFKDYFSKLTYITFRRSYNGKLIDAKIISLSVRNRKVRVKNMKTGAKYWVADYWITDRN